jgi:hypothetical protein
LEDDILPGFDLHDLPPSHRLPFLQGAVHERIGGGRVYDAHIADVARHAGATVVVTENMRHFTSLRRYSVRVWTSAELVDEAKLPRST